MLIFNGRAFGDKGVGKPTCKDKYVVDYVICSSSSMMFCQILKLKNCTNFIQMHIMLSNLP